MVRIATLSSMVIVVTMLCISGCITPANTSHSSVLGPTVTSTTQYQGVTGPTPPATPLPDDTRFLTRIPVTGIPGATTPTGIPVTPPTPIPMVVQNIYHNVLPFQGNTVAYAYTLTDPPLTIHFDLQPRIDERTIWYESRTGTYDANGNRADVFVTVPQVSPDAWFEITVRDQASGNVVIDDGYGKTFGGGMNKTVTLRTSGSYRIEMAGDQVNATIDMDLTHPAS